MHIENVEFNYVPFEGIIIDIHVFNIFFLLIPGIVADGLSTADQLPITFYSSHYLKSNSAGPGFWHGRFDSEEFIRFLKQMIKYNRAKIFFTPNSILSTQNEKTTYMVERK